MSFAMQTAKGYPATGVTQAEFIEVMKRVRTAFYQKAGQGEGRWAWRTALGLPLSGSARQRYELEKKLKPDDPKDGWLPIPDWDPIFSFDHPPAHGGRTGAAVLSALGLEPEDHFPLSVNSPDLHRVIERVHARLQEQFVRWFCGYDRRQRPSIQYKAVIQELFYNNAQVASPGVIAADVRGLPELYNKVIELDGLRAPRPWC